ncbi:unnamed protein product [Linum trigynum]|uniref:Reverse transcriptase zinc-binding domain-containing protein n=1 Tax=Linum trigynum TaxID=586398 RepID=A0AAV2E9Q1_9ROSI
MGMNEAFMIKIEWRLVFNGSLNEAFARAFLPEDMVQQLLLHPVPQGTEPDVPIWRLSSSGRFTMKTSYELTRRDDDHHEHPIWKIAWQVEGIQRTRTFFELAMHQRLLTNVERCRRHLALMDACRICGGGPETILHIIRDCPYARAVWSE